MKRLAALAAVPALLALACNTLFPPSSSTQAPAQPTIEAQPVITVPSSGAATPLATAGKPAGSGALNPNPPEQPVKLIFIHHSSGGNWLADPAGNGGYGGDLGRALMESNYFVSATNYGWGPNGIGDRTDIGHWWEWFQGPSSDKTLRALYRESGQNFGDFGPWPRLATDPGGENEIVLFKSCFPNSALSGGPGDAPTTGGNPLHTQDAWSRDMTVANAKGIYVDLLGYFVTQPERLFVVITAPPLHEADTTVEQGANARAFNRWLVADWLSGYPLANVAVFDYYNVLTSNASDGAANDLGSDAGNHHRFRDGKIEYVTDQGGDTSAYAAAGDSHPTAAGNQKATGEFVPLLNVFYHRWQEAGQ